MILFFAKISISLLISSSNVNEIIEKTNKKEIFVFLISDFCPHCNTIKPIIKSLEDTYINNSYILIGKINCDYDKMLCKEFPNSVTPSFFYINQTINNSIQYKGANDLSEMKSFIEKQISYDIINVTTWEEFDKKCKVINESSIFYTKNINSKQLDIIKTIAFKLKNYPCHFFNFVDNLNENGIFEFCNMYYPTNKTICFGEKQITEKKLLKFAKRHAYPIVGPISEQLLNITKELKSTILLLADEYPFFITNIQEMSSDFNDNLISATIDCANSKGLCYKLLIEKGNGPKILMYNPSKKYIWYYRNEMKNNAILEWINNVLDGKIRPTGPGTGFLGYIGNLFDISQDGGIIQLSIFVIALSVLILVFVFGIADSTYRRNRLYKKLQ